MKMYVHVYRWLTLGDDSAYENNEFSFVDSKNLLIKTSVKFSSEYPSSLRCTLTTAADFDSTTSFITILDTTLFLTLLHHHLSVY